MNLNDDARNYLIHIEEEFNNLDNFTNGLTFDGYKSTVVIQYAIQKSLENIGEACRYINEKDKSSKSNFPNFDFKGLIAFKNVLNHGYFSIDYQEVWDTLKDDLPEIKKSFYELFNDDLEILSASGKRKHEPNPSTPTGMQIAEMMSMINSPSVQGDVSDIKDALKADVNKANDHDEPTLG